MHKPLSSMALVNYQGRLYLFEPTGKVFEVDPKTWKFKARPDSPTHNQSPVAVPTPKGVMLVGGGGWGPNTNKVHLSCGYP